MSVPEPGGYDGEIASVGIETDPYHDGGLVLCFEVRLLKTNEIVRPRHSTEGDYADKTRAIVEGPLGLEWPAGIERLVTTVGKVVPVWISEGKNGKAGRAYIQTGKRGVPATADAISRWVAKQSGASPDDETPF